MLNAEDLLDALKDTGWLREALAIEAVLIDYRNSRAAEGRSLLSVQQIQADELDLVVERMTDALFGGVHQRLFAQRSLRALSSEATVRGAEEVSFKFSEDSDFGSIEELELLSLEADEHEFRLVSSINRARNSD
jgi:hypothetical protein